jgi:hypothetical protein
VAPLAFSEEQWAHTTGVSGAAPQRLTRRRPRAGGGTGPTRLRDFAQLGVDADKTQQRGRGVLDPRVGVVLEDGFQKADGFVVQAKEGLEVGEGTQCLRW